MSTLVSLNTIRTNLQAARRESGTAESQFKTIESDSDSLRKAADAIETYEARHDDESKDISDEGKAAVRALSSIAGKQQTLQQAHQTEESERRQLATDLSEARGDSEALNVPPGEKSSLLSAINNAQQTDQSGNWSYQAVDTALYAADLQLPNAQGYASDVADDDKGKDVRVKGEELEQNLQRLAKSYSDATSAADRSELQQDRVGGHVEAALREVDKLENKALQPFLDDVPFVAFAADAYRLAKAMAAIPQPAWSLFDEI